MRMKRESAPSRPLCTKSCGRAVRATAQASKCPRSASGEGRRLSSRPRLRALRASQVCGISRVLKGGLTSL
eukprot:10958204-Alexandrium_andersonii.AAC.1